MIRIESWAQARRHVPAILEKVNADPRVALAAMVNPILAAEEFGYEFSSDVRGEIEERVRFGEQGAAERKTLRAQIFEKARQEFSLESPEDLHRILFEELKIGSPRKGQRRQWPECTPEEARDIVRPPRRGPDGRFIDDLEPFARAHPIVPLLLRYRRAGAENPPFGSRADYDRVRRGQAKLPVGRVRYRLQERER